MHFCLFFKCLLFAVAKERSVFSVSLETWLFILMVSQRPFPRELSFVCHKPNLHWRDVHTDLSLEWLLHFLKRKKKLLSKTFHICVLYWNVFPFAAFSFNILLAVFSDIPQKDKFHNKHSYTCLDYVIKVLLFLPYIYPFCPSLQPHIIFFFFYKFQSKFQMSVYLGMFWEAWDDLPVSCCPGTATSGLRELNLLLNVWFSSFFFPLAQLQLQWSFLTELFPWFLL